MERSVGMVQACLLYGERKIEEGKVGASKMGLGLVRM